MKFFKVTFWASISTGTSMVCGLITTKYIAVIIGPEGMAYVGQFLNATVVILLLATGACATGIVKYLSQHKDETKRLSIFSNAMILSGACLLITSLVVIFFSGILSKNFFNTKSFRDVFLIYGIFMIFPTFNTLASAVLNGLQQIRQMAIISISSSCLYVVAVIIAAKFFGLKGVLLANLISAFFTFFLYLFLLKKQGLFINKKLLSAYDPSALKLLLGYSLMSIVSGIIAPSLQLFVRTKLLHNFNANTAGLWQANMRLSDSYLNFIYTVIGMYYLPRLSELFEISQIRREIKLAFLRILPVVILITITIWVFRFYIVKIFLTGNFMDMLVLLKWQLIGDVIKIASWILGYLMVAKAMKKTFISTELIFSVTYVLLNYWFINNYGMVGTVYAFTLNYSLYLICLTILFRKYIF